MSPCRSMGVIHPETSTHKQKVDFAPASPIVSKVNSKVIELPETPKGPQNQRMIIFRKRKQHMSSGRSMGVIRSETSTHEQKVDFAPASPIVSKINSKVIELPETPNRPQHQNMFIYRKHKQHMSSCRSMGVIRSETSTHEQKVDFPPASPHSKRIYDHIYGPRRAKYAFSRLIQPTRAAKPIVSDNHQV